MGNGLFRQESLDRISSPEELHDYMKVTSPKIWMILSAIVVLLAGFIVYASTASQENTIAVKVKLQREYWEEGERPTVFATCSIPDAQKDVVKTGAVVRIGNENGRVEWMIESGEENTITAGIRMDNENTSLPDGEYEATLVLESITPISFLWN